MCKEQSEKCCHTTLTRVVVSSLWAANVEENSIHLSLHAHSRLHLPHPPLLFRGTGGTGGVRWVIFG